MRFSAVEIKEYFCGGLYKRQGKKKSTTQITLNLGGEENVDEIVEMEVPQVSKNYRLHHCHGVTWCTVGKAANNHCVSRDGK